METSRLNQSESNENIERSMSLKEMVNKVGSFIKILKEFGMRKGHLMVRCVTLLSTLMVLQACGSNPIDKCLGDKEGEKRREKVERTTKHCNESVDDLLQNDDSSLYYKRRKQAENDCIKASEEILALETSLRAALEVHISKRKRSEVKSCRTGIKESRSLARNLNRGPIRRMNSRGR